MDEQKERLTGAEKLVGAERVELERLQAQPRGPPPISGKAVLDRVQVAVTVELGRTQISVKDLRACARGRSCCSTR